MLEMVAVADAAAAVPLSPSSLLILLLVEVVEYIWGRNAHLILPSRDGAAAADVAKTSGLKITTYLRRSFVVVGEYFVVNLGNLIKASFTHRSKKVRLFMSSSSCKSSTSSDHLLMVHL